ncbi:hypothetical protein HPB52_008787 [Rhipicephalus sanguineus]|uniref:Galactosyltransferase N-terminal domain-containing protein n=1 Tax=Rhipicephalus sanguineus TaxID=34632 RepID=A0A9D4SY17_RHISA|nr:hypothetical protein HPB52_008787 [Rhipicephalus sanguineus]
MVQPSSAMADANPEDLSHVSGPESSTGSTTPRAPKKSRPTAARKSSGVIQTRARKLRAAAASRIRKSPAGSTPNSRPRSQASRKMAATSKAATTVPLAKTSNVTTAEAAAAITPILRPPTLRFEAPQQPETGSEIGKGATLAAQAASDDTGSSSSSPASSSSWEHTTPPSSPSLSPSPCRQTRETGTCTDRPGRQLLSQQASSATFCNGKRTARAHSAPPDSRSHPPVHTAHVCCAARHADVTGKEGAHAGFLLPAHTPHAPSPHSPDEATGSPVSEEPASAVTACGATGGQNLAASDGLASPLSTSVDPKGPLPIEETQADSRQERTSSELVPPTPQEGHTIIFRPVGKKSHFLTATRDTIAAYLSGFTATKSVRVNHRRNLVAVDTVASGDISALLGVKKIADIPVKAKILETDTCVGTIYGVDADIAAEELAAIIDSSVPLESCVRRGNAVHITFSGTVVPAEVHLYKQRRPVRARLPRPLQCARCGIYGHATATCARDRRCLRCGKSHAEGPCPSERPRCLNCQGTHAANEPRCSSWQIQRQAAFLLAASRGKLTRRQALERAQTAAKGKQSGVLAATTTRPGHSFRDALKGRANAAPTSRTGPAGTSASASTPSSAPTSADDPRDTVMAALAAALRALLNSVSGNGNFNRAKLLNVGYEVSKTMHDYNCFIFHNEDLITEND